MSLRSQLLLVSLLLVSLPWAGCEYLREMESTLREGQGMAASASVRAIAAALRDREDLLYPPPLRGRTAADTGQDWYLPPARRALISDGYADDWREQPQLVALDALPPGVEVRAATWGARLFLLFSIADATPLYSRPGARPGANGDRVSLLCQDARGLQQRYLIAPEAPGYLRAQRADNSPDQLADRIRGAWREGSGAWTLELQMPLVAHCPRLAFSIIDATPAGDVQRHDSRSRYAGATPWLVYRVAALDRWLAAFSEPGRRIVVYDRQGWPVGGNASSAALRGDGEQAGLWILRTLYRAALRGAAAPAGAGASGWRAVPSPDSSAMLLEATAPILAGEAPLGSVQLTETAERYLALTDRASARVFAISALVLAIAVLGLLAFATLLSWRVRRLRDATHAIAANTRSPGQFPRSRAADEIGELSRSYADLLAQISDYNTYLRGLARTLSHELRTPIAVVGSSLDHLAAGGLAQPERASYLQRARDGLARLTRIVGAMSEASRIEESLRGVTFERLDVSRFLRDLRAAYAATFSGHRFRLELPTVGVEISGSGDLLAQALDKLVDNAVSFARTGTAITLRLESTAEDIRIAVSNQGPPLPGTLRERLFEPMISLRSEGDGDTHLGLGLYIARCVAEAHGGRLEAADRPDGDGAVFTLCLPRRPCAIS